MIYKNGYGTQVYPFTVPVPFPVGLIADMKICLKQVKQIDSQQLFVSAISGGNETLTVTLSTTAHGVLCTFKYVDNLWITVNNEQVFGFLLLNYIPRESFSYVGRWYIQRRCYTLGTKLKGLSKAGIAGAHAAEGPLLQLRTGGLFTERARLQNTEIRGTYYDTVINIGRDTEDPHKQLTQEFPNKLPYISSVNGVSKAHLLISSSDSTIHISDPVQTDRKDIYVMYIGTEKEFPHCPQWDTSSSATEEL